ncbi:PREDICTED: C-type lectin domain family 2 member D-like [Gekko japonicus]|uniref:C-type lectin domain family 2 member D-like n=1 Tax=Gekko japonicus TaxID=146911 RepID=A0ABM1KRS3_GEKJA|nr:PREDICTED: C-type lectin domain family 2 member D-like [Gekko japonicus]
MPQRDALAPNGHLVGQNNSANSRICKFLKRKAIACFSLLTVILTIVIIVLGVKLHGQQSHGLVSPTPCPVSRPSFHVPCPSRWVGYEGMCYFFSTEERTRTSSHEFCSSYNASLATVENEEKDAVLRYREKVPYWIGLTRRSGQPWKWPDGQIASLEVLGEGDNCAYLSDEAEAKASVSRCGTEHRWICSRSSNPTGT